MGVLAKARSMAQKLMYVYTLNEIWKKWLMESFKLIKPFHRAAK